MYKKINIPEFGERYCSYDVEYFSDLHNYSFYKKEIDVLHNEYGPASEWSNGSFIYLINDRCHRLNGPAYYNAERQDYLEEYYVIGIFLGYTQENFISNLSNTLIPEFNTINRNFY